MKLQPRLGVGGGSPQQEPGQELDGPCQVVHGRKPVRRRAARLRLDALQVGSLEAALPLAEILDGTDAPPQLAGGAPAGKEQECIAYPRHYSVLPVVVARAAAGAAGAAGPQAELAGMRVDVAPHRLPPVPQACVREQQHDVAELVGGVVRQAAFLQEAKALPAQRAERGGALPAGARPGEPAPVRLAPLVYCRDFEYRGGVHQAVVQPWPPQGAAGGEQAARLEGVGAVVHAGRRLLAERLDRKVARHLSAVAAAAPAARPRHQDSPPFPAAREGARGGPSRQAGAAPAAPGESARRTPPVISAPTPASAALPFP